MIEHQVGLEPAPGDVRGLELDRRPAGGHRTLRRATRPPPQLGLDRAASR